MSGKIELTISESTLERLRCSVCEGYLSCPPIRILPDGNSICGRCSPPDKDVSTYIQFNLEAIMRDATFPCKFAHNGCKMRLPFGYTSTNDHEAECTYRNGPLPEALPKAGCSTETPEQVDNDNVPSTFVLCNAELTVKVDGDAKRVPVVDANDSTVINPFSVRKASNASSIVSLRNWNGNFNPPPRPPTRANSWNGSYDNSFDRNGYNSQRNWHNMPPGRPWNSYNRFGYRGRSYHNKRKNNVVIIKGHTLYITL